MMIALLAALLLPQGPRDIGPLVELEAHAAPRITQITGDVIVPWFSDSHVQFFGLGWNEAAWRSHLQLMKLTSAKGFVGLGDYGGAFPWHQSSLNKFAEILHQEMTTTDPLLVAGIGNHEWFDGVGRRPWMEGIYPTVAFTSFTTATESDRPFYHSHLFGNQQGTRLRVVITDSSGVKGIPPATWIVAEQIGDKQLHWLHKTLRAAREAGDPTVVLDHYPDVMEQGGTLVPVLSNGLQRLRTVMQFDNVSFMGGAHIGASQDFLIAENPMRPGTGYIIDDFGPQAFRARPGGFVEPGYIFSSGTFVATAPTYALYGPTDYGHPFGIWHYGHASISNVIDTDTAILTTADQTPVAGSAVAIRATWVPPNAPGVYMLCAASDVLGTTAGSVVYFVDPSNSIPINVVADPAGHAVVPIPLGAGTANVTWYGQFFFSHPQTGELIASDAHRVTVQ